MNATQRYWARRAELQQRSAVLRERLAVHAVATQPLFGMAEKMRETGRFIQRHPWLPLVLAVALVLRRPRSALRWAWKGWAVWRWAKTWADRWHSAGRP